MLCGRPEIRRFIPYTGRYSLSFIQLPDNSIQNQGGRLGTEKKKFNTHLASKRSVIERAFGLLGLRFPRLLKLKCKNHDKRILCVVACCVLHNWCLMEDDNDISSFNAMDELETDGHLGLPAAAVLGNTVDCGSGTHKRDQLCRQIADMD